jgi:hypothetical protein
MATMEVLLPILAAPHSRSWETGTRSEPGINLFDHAQPADANRKATELALMPPATVRQSCGEL